MQGTAKLMAMNRTDFTSTNREITIAVRLRAIHQNATRTVHGLNAELLLVDDRGVHVVLVMIPMARRFPQLLAHDKRCGDFHVSRLMMDFPPVIKQSILQDHAVRKEEGEAWSLFAHHEDVHFAADTTMVALFRLFEIMQILVQIGLLKESRAIKTLQLFAACIASPVRTSELHHLKCANFARRGNMGACAQIHKGSMAVHRDFAFS